MSWKTLTLLILLVFSQMRKLRKTKSNHWIILFIYSTNIDWTPIVVQTLFLFCSNYEWNRQSFCPRFIKEKERESTIINNSSNEWAWLLTSIQWHFSLCFCWLTKTNEISDWLIDSVLIRRNNPFKKFILWRMQSLLDAAIKRGLQRVI